MNPNISWPSMFIANPSTSQSQWGEASNPSAISSQRQSYEGISSENEERSKQETNPRWNPMPEQIRLLESIFNSGVTNPTPKEIERIRDQLQEFGQVRDASVFYWFQNKKARTKRRQRLLQSGETSKSISEKSKTDQSEEIIGVADTTTNSLGNAGETYSSVVPAAQVSSHQEHYHLQMNERISNDQCSYTDAVAATISRAGIFNEGAGEKDMYDCSITVFINNVPVQVPVGPINVKGMFGENAVLCHSTGQPILLNEWGFTMEGLQHGAMYYWI